MLVNRFLNDHLLDLVVANLLIRCVLSQLDELVHLVFGALDIFLVQQVVEHLLAPLLNLDTVQQRCLRYEFEEFLELGGCGVELFGEDAPIR